MCTMMVPKDYGNERGMGYPLSTTHLPPSHRDRHFMLKKDFAFQKNRAPRLGN